MQGERDKLALSKQELERAVRERTAHTEELERQLAEKMENCQLLEVPSSHKQCSHLVALTV